MVVSTGIAILIGVPLGILLTRKPSLSKPILGVANIMQTVPSLALFGFLIPLNLYLFQVKIVGGIGARTAIVALFSTRCCRSFATLSRESTAWIRPFGRPAAAWG